MSCGSDRFHHFLLSIPGNQPSRSEGDWENKCFKIIIYFHKPSRAIVVTSQSLHAFNGEVFFFSYAQTHGKLTDDIKKGIIISASQMAGFGEISSLKNL